MLSAGRFHDLTLRQEHWKPNFRKATIGAVSTTYVFRFFPFLRHGMKIAPLFTRWMDESMLTMTKMMNEQIPDRVRLARKQHEAGITLDRPSIFSTLMGSTLPEAEKTDARLIGEGFTTISAGTETTAVRLTSILIPISTWITNIQVVDPRYHHLLPPQSTRNSSPAHKRTS